MVPAHNATGQALINKKKIQYSFAQNAEKKWNSSKLGIGIE